MFSAFVCSLPFLIAAEPTAFYASAAATGPITSAAADAAAWVPPVITSVARDADKRTLVVRYRTGEKAGEQRLKLPAEIADFRYAPWLTAGIAIVARTGEKEKSEYYFAAFGLSPEPKVHAGARLKAPAEELPILGIGNTGGDSVVITAMKYDRAGRGTVAGWIYVDNCPHTYITDIERLVTPLPAIHPPM